MALLSHGALTVALASTASVNAVNAPDALQADAQPASEQQSSDQQADNGEYGEPDFVTDVIVVSAQKREERITDVPLTITALSGDDLRRLNANELDEISLYVPGLFIQEQSANNPGFVIRGITSDSGSAQQGPRVTVYYNGVDISRSRGVYQDLYDLERVEVIKGPQATLFGTASTIGAVSFVSAKPEPGTSAELQLGYGNFDWFQAQGHINIGNDEIALRVASAFRRRDGWVRNIAGDPNIPNQNTAGIDQPDLYAQNQLGVRASLRWTPIAIPLTVDLVGTYDRQRNSGTPFVSGTLPATGGSTSPFDPVELSGSPFSREILGLSELGLERDVYDVSLTVNYEISDSLTYTQITAYRDFDSLEVFDADGSPAFYLEFAEDAEGYQINHESRLSYTGDRFRGFVGINYFYENGSQAVPFSTEEGTYLQCAAGLIPGLPCVAPDGTVTAEQATALLTQGAATFIPYASLFGNRGINDAFSVFFDGTVIPTPALELTAGVRFLFEDRQSFFSADQPNSVITGAPLLPTVDTAGQEFGATDEFFSVLPRFNALVRFNDRFNGYATVSRGRRSPVIDVTSATGPNGPIAAIDNIPAEFVWNYEAGLKYADSLVQASVGVFYQEYENFQVTIQNDAGDFITVNAGNASSTGVEAELSISPADWLTIFGNGAYIDSSIDNEPENGIFVGDRFRLQSEWQLSGGFTIDYPINDSTRFFLTPSVTYQSDLFFELPNNPNIAEDGYALVNIRGGISFEEGRYEIAGFARNLFDEQYLIDGGNTGGAFGIPTFIPGEPAFYGVQVTARY
ncbi:MAG: TonB-dependent receptor [Pseudomonadota bacterium]